MQNSIATNKVKISKIIKLILLSIVWLVPAVLAIYTLRTGLNPTLTFDERNYYLLITTILLIVFFAWKSVYSSLIK